MFNHSFSAYWQIVLWINDMLHVMLDRTALFCIYHVPNWPLRFKFLRPSNEHFWEKLKSLTETLFENTWKTPDIVTGSDWPIAIYSATGVSLVIGKNHIKECPVSHKVWHAKEPSLFESHKILVKVKMCSPYLAMVTRLNIIEIFAIGTKPRWNTQTYRPFSFKNCSKRMWLWKVSSIVFR